MWRRQIETTVEKK